MIEVNKYKAPIIAKNEIKICIENNNICTDKKVELICNYIKGILRDAKNQYKRK
jgi:hypothetical protein